MHTSLGKKHLVRPLLRTEITQVVNLLIAEPSKDSGVRQEDWKQLNSVARGGG